MDDLIGPKVELTSLVMRDEAELARYILASAGVDFIDVRITGRELNKRKKLNKGMKSKFLKDS